MNSRSFTALAFALFCSVWTIAAQADVLNISGAWVREGPPTTQVLAAYLQIDNPGTQDIAIVGARSPQFENVEIHRTEIVDGMARMIQQDRLVVPAGGKVTLGPGGLHLMLIQALKPLHRGDHVEIQLQLDNGDSLKIDTEVRPDMENDLGHGMDHTHMDHQH